MGFARLQRAAYARMHLAGYLLAQLLSGLADVMDQMFEGALIIQGVWATLREEKHSKGQG